MESIWMGIASGARSTRVVAMSGPGETFLKAQLDSEPRHARALGTLLEAVLAVTEKRGILSSPASVS